MLRNLSLSSLLSNSAGSLRLTLFLARRDWVMSLCWLLGLGLFATLIPLAMYQVYGVDEAMLQAMIPMLQNPAMVALVGPVWDAYNYTIGALVAGEMLLFAAIAVAFMNILFIVRYTRADEEAERAEIIRSLPVGRLAPLNAALIAALALNVVVTLITWVGLAAMNIPTVDWTGAFLYAAVCGAVGIVFAGIAAVCAQIASTSRAAISYSSAVLGLLFFMRAAGDVFHDQGYVWAETLSRLSVLGLGLRVEAFVSDHFWPLPWMLLQAVALVGLAYFLNSRRDLGAGLIPAKAGSAHAGLLLRSNFGLALRLLRNTLIGWAAVSVILGASYGSIMNQIADFVETSPLFQAALQNDLGYGIVEAFASMIMLVLAAMCAAAPLVIALKAWREEAKGRTELLFATPTSRRSYLGSYVVIALTAAVAMPLLAAFGMWAAAALVMSEPLSAGFYFQAMAVYLPAIWVLTALAFFIVAARPHLASAITWGYYAFAFLMGYFADLFPDLPNWVQNLSVFGMSPNITQEKIPWITLGIMTALAATLITAAFIFYQDRDLENA